MKLRKRIILLLGIISMLTITTGCVNDKDVSVFSGEKTYEFIISSNQPDTHPTVQALKEFAKDLETNSNGTMKATVYSNGVLGSDTETLQMVQFGAIDMLATGSATIESYNDIYSIFSVPYLFDSEEHYYKVMDSSYMKENVFKSTAKNGFIVQAWFDAGARSFYTKNKVINSPEDLKGLKLRTLVSPTLMEMVSMMGGNPTPLDWNEVYAALQQGVIDGLENNELALTVNKHGEVAKEFSNTKHLYAPDVLIINKKIYDSLSEKQQKVFDETTTELSLKQRDLWHKATDEAIAQAKKDGVTFTDPDIDKFKSLVKPMREDLAKKYPDIYKVIEDLK